MSYMKPTIKLGAKDPRLAMYAHLLSLFGGAIAVITGILGLLNGNILAGLIGILVAIFVVVVELDTISIEPLKDALVRGIVWIVLFLINIAGDWYAGLAVGIGGILYLVYHFK